MQIGARRQHPSLIAYSHVQHVWSENSDLIKNFRLVNSLKGLAKEFNIQPPTVCNNLIDEHRDWGWDEQQQSVKILEAKLGMDLELLLGELNNIRTNFILR